MPRRAPVLPSLLFADMPPKGDGYDRVVPGKPDKPSAKPRVEESSQTSGISGMVNVSGGCDTFMESKSNTVYK